MATSFKVAARRYWLGAALLGLLAFVGMRWVAPWGIRMVHAGRVPLVGRLIPGRDSVPVQTYLDLWAGLEGELAFFLALAVLLGFLAFVLLWHTAPSRRSEAETPADDPSHSSTLRYALWFALVAGLGEGSYLIAKYLLFRKFPANLPEVSEHAIWMTSVDHLLVALAVWGILVALGARVAALRRPQVFAFLLPALGWLSWFGTAGRIAPWAAALLSAGLAVQWVRREPFSAPAFDALVRKTLPWGFALVVVLGGALPLFRVGSEWAALRALPQAPAGAPNVVLVVFDTQRALNMGLYGYERDTTPHVDALAKESVVFDRAFSSAPWTLPSHATMFTGRWPHELGVGFLDPLDDTYPVLSELFAAQGYRTGGFAGNLAFVTRMYGLARGFQHFDNQRVYPNMMLKQSWLIREPWRQIRRKLGLSGYLISTPAWKVNEWFLEWQRRDSDRPFFAFVNYIEPHEPYDPPTEFRGRFGGGDGLTWLKHGSESKNYSADEMQQLVDHYDEDVATVDQAFANLYAELTARGLLDNTILVLTSDHGDEFGEHGWLDHIHTVYATTTHVPLLIRLPDGAHAGERVSEPVSLRDLASTVLDLAEVPAAVPGESLARFFGAPAATDSLRGELILSELGQTRGIVEGDYRYVWIAQGGEGLFDVWRDRYEATDLTAQQPEVRERALGRLRGMFPDIGPDGKSLQPNQ